MADVFTLGFLDNMKILFVAVLIYAVIYALLKKLEVLGKDDKINSLIALLTAIIVSFSGVVTYAVSYAINWFIIIFFIVFLLILILLFLGVDIKDITKQSKDNAKYILVAFGILFFVIIVKSFFALNNTFDNNDPIEDQYEIDTSFNTGVDDITNVEVDDNWYNTLLGSIDKDLIGAVIFLVVIGVFVIVIGK